MNATKYQRTRRLGPLVWALVAGACLLGAPALASAQACCTATGAGEFAVVGRCQSAVIATQLTYQHGLGTYTDRGDYRGIDHAQVDDVTLSLGGGFRPFHPQWQVYGSVPLRLQYRAFDAAGSDLRLGPGDAAAGVRWTALQDAMGGLALSDPSTLTPFLDLYATLKTPTGRAPEDTEVTTGADITGDGAWQLAAGAKLSKFLTPNHVVGLQGTYSHLFARTIEKANGQTTDYAPGAEVDLTATYLHIHDLFWSWGLNSSLKFAGETVADGKTVPDSQTRRLRFGGHVTHGFDFPKWEATLSVTVDAWWDGASANLPFVGPAASLAIRRQWM